MFVPRSFRQRRAAAEFERERKMAVTDNDAWEALKAWKAPPLDFTQLKSTVSTAAAARSLIELPMEVVHQIMDDIPVCRLLEMAASLYVRVSD